MTWLALVLALVLDQMSFPGLRSRIDAALTAWPRWLRAQAATPRFSTAPPWLASVVAVLGPAVLASWLYASLEPFLGWCWLVFVLYVCLGFGGYLRSAAVIADALEWGDEAALQQLLHAQLPKDQFLGAGMAQRALAALLLLAQRQVLGILAAVVLGWLLGLPLLLVVAVVMAQRWEVLAVDADDGLSSRLTEVSWLQTVETLATVVSVGAMALSSRFDAVLATLRSGDRVRSPLQRLADAAAVVLDLPEDWLARDRGADEPGALTLEHLLRWEAWIWRLVGVWLLLLAALGLLLG